MIRIDKTPPIIQFFDVICGDIFHKGQNGYVPVTSKDSMSGIARRDATGHEDGGQLEEMQLVMKMVARQHDFTILIMVINN